MKTVFVLCALFYAAAAGTGAQALRDNSGASSPGQGTNAQSASLPLKRIVVFSSGLAYYEHSGLLSAQSVLSLPFKTAAVNDALKSLVINDPASPNPSVSYQSEQTLLQTLRSLSVDLSDEPGMADILSRLRGAEVELSAPVSISGKVMGIELREASVSPFSENMEPWLSLYTPQGLKLINLKDINTLQFKDGQINHDLNRALDLITSSRKQNTRDLVVQLPGSGSRQVSLSYVIPSPVWKVSYRLDLGAKDGKPLFQGWAIVDNDGDTDWNNVELSLAAGRPASFIQNLYPPYYLSRPVLPLAIAGAASAQSHEGGYISMGFTGGEARKTARNNESMVLAERQAEEYYDESAMSMSLDSAVPAPRAVAGGTIQGAAGSAAGDQFEFTIRKPVSLDRRMSAMLPLVESALEGRKLIIFSGAVPANTASHPRLGAELTNSSGMKLPAGPITVYDGGTYAGDALIEFWNQDEKRLISFGEDLSVNASVSETESRAVSAVTLSGGLMTISRSLTQFKTYTFKNTGEQSKLLVVEHPKTPGTTLVSPEADEVTPGAYRFTMTLQGGRELLVMVSEERPLHERISLTNLRPEAFASYASNQEIPANVRTALQRAVELLRNVSASETALDETESRRDYLEAEQDRIRKNLEASGSQTQQGQEYLRRLVSIDNDIDALGIELEKARANLKAARKTYEDYITGLDIGNR